MPGVRVVVQAREEVGRFPQMVFISEKTGRVLLRSSIEYKDKWLIPDERDSAEFRPNLVIALRGSFPALRPFSVAPVKLGVGPQKGRKKEETDG